MASKAQWRNTEAQKLTLDLIDLGYIRKSEKVAGKLLLLACIRAEERTKTSMKPAYKGVQFNFDSPLEMAIHIITELPKEWAYCKELKVQWQQAKGKKAKNLLVVTIDRIIDGSEGNRGHYERGNIQILSFEANRAKSAQKKMKPRALFGNSGHGTELVVGESITATASILGVKNHETAKRYSYPYTRLEPTATEAEHKEQCKAYGITYQTAQERAESDSRFLEQAFNK